ncbi:uncharacterized, partial [Tachysurus ichikawai]
HDLHYMLHHEVQVRFQRRESQHEEPEALGIMS